MVSIPSACFSKSSTRFVSLREVVLLQEKLSAYNTFVVRRICCCRCFLVNSLTRSVKPCIVECLLWCYLDEGFYFYTEMKALGLSCGPVFYTVQSGFTFKKTVYDFIHKRVVAEIVKQFFPVVLLLLSFLCCRLKVIYIFELRIYLSWRLTFQILVT